MKPEEFKSIKLKYLTGRRTLKQQYDNSWEVNENLSVTLSNGEIIVIPKGFTTDFSSVPEFLWGLLKPFGDFILAPIVHDYLYRSDYMAKELGLYKARLFADKEMLYISNITNSNKWHNRLDNKLRFWLVRLLGARQFKKNTRDVANQHYNIN